MELTGRQGSLTQVECDAVIVNLFEGVRQPGGATGAVDRALGGAIARQIREEDFRGRLGDTMIVHTCGKIPCDRVVVVGLGGSGGFGPGQILRAAGAAARKCQELRARRVASILHGAGIAGVPTFDCARAVCLGTILGAYEFRRLKTENAKPTIEYFEIVELSADKLPEIEQGIARGRVIGDAVSFARDLVNEPSNVVTPPYLAELAERIARENGMTCRVLDRAGIEEAGMGLLAAVARGSATEPRFIEMRCEIPGAARTVAIIGKGITFDSGGYNLKSGDSISGMKDDMAGAAAVLAVMRALGSLKPSVNVIALIPATENMIGGTAIHPGDVFTSLAGKTVEINNTDAEGRLILADAVAYARKAGVDEIIDAATLTGGCVVALGRQVSGVFGTDQRIVEKIISAGALCGEQMWQLPLHEDYREAIKSDVADMKNTGNREGSAIVGALFIKDFVGDTPWTHIDLSSVAHDKDTPVARKGATGIPAGTLLEYLTAQ